jgi:phosphate butyryltransferase
MTIKNFGEVVTGVKKLGSRKIAVAAAEDEEILKAVRQAQDEGLARAILVGNQPKIEELAKEHSLSLDGFEIINEPDPFTAAQQCCTIVREGKASIIVKGLIDTSKLMKAVLNKEHGLNSGNLISHVAAFQVPTYPKLLFVTDAAVNVNPTLEQKVGLINNSVKVAQSLQIEKPLVACVCGVEKVNAKAMPETIDAALLAKMNDRGQILECIVDGPFGLDNAINEDSAKKKKISSPVAGQADILLCPDLLSANMLYKSLIFLGGAKCGAVVMGATAPIVLTSRADSHETKYLSILLGLLSAG